MTSTVCANLTGTDRCYRPRPPLPVYFLTPVRKAGNGKFCRFTFTIDRAMFMPGRQARGEGWRSSCKQTTITHTQVWEGVRPAMHLRSHVPRWSYITTTGHSGTFRSRRRTLLAGVTAAVTAGYFNEMPVGYRFLVRGDARN